MINKRKLGNTDIEVAPFAFGGNVFGWTLDEVASHKMLDEFVDAGFNLIDTADVYSNWIPGNEGGESETIIGNWLSKRGNREKVVIATKVGGEMSPGNKGLSKAHILKSVDESLKRLQTEYIDLYQSHYDDPDTPLEETLSTYADLIKTGKIRAVGASNYPAARLQEALKLSTDRGLPAYQTLQPLYNLYDRQEFERDLAAVCREYGLSVLNYYSLASGFLTGKYRSENDLSKSPRGGGVKKYMNDRGFRILDTLDAVAAEYDATPAQIAMAWLIQRPGIAAPIASATSSDQLKDLIRATELNLDEPSVKKLNEVSE